MTIEEIIAANYHEYGIKRMAFKNGELTLNEWLEYVDMVMTAILNSDDAINIMTRMKNN